MDQVYILNNEASFGRIDLIICKYSEVKYAYPREVANWGLMKTFSRDNFRYFLIKKIIRSIIWIFEHIR